MTNGRYSGFLSNRLVFCRIDWDQELLVLCGLVGMAGPNGCLGPPREEAKKMGGADGGLG